MNEALRLPRVSGAAGIGIIALHLLAGALFFVDIRLPFVLLATVIGVVVALERPVWGIGLLVAGRLTSTGANAWVRIGKINLDLFEPALLLALGALLVHAARHQRPVWVDAPWRGPVLAFLGWQVISLLWSTAPSEALQEIVATSVFLLTTLVILSMIRTWNEIRTVLLVWIAASLCIGLLSAVGVLATDSAFEMAQGSRESGFGQHPNWFAMNLSFGVPISFGLALVEAQRKGGRPMGALLVLAGVVLFLAQMRSGSRGGTYSILLGGAAVALFHPTLRKLAIRLAVVLSVIIGIVVLSDLGDSSQAYGRILEAGTLLGKGVRPSNWSVCWQMFADTWGRGIGGGGYADLLARYDWWLYTSQYRYPHGIFWGILAHYGVIGLAILGWFCFGIVRMGQGLFRDTRGRPQQMVVLTMAASFLGYAAWSFVEFSYDDKPFWEFLALFTALAMWAKKEPVA